MNKAPKLAILALVAAGGLAGAASQASAAVVCNAERVCWHVRSHYDYKPEWGLVVHPNRWHWARTEHYQWREHRGRGYWRNGAWVRF
jgi:hypothetical protein